MSQAGSLNAENINPDIPLVFQTDIGVAVADMHVIVIRGSNGAVTYGNDNIVTIDVSALGITLSGNPPGMPVPPLTSNFCIQTANATPIFVGTPGTLTLNFALNNLILGSSGEFITSGVANVGFGAGSLQNITEADFNVAVGTNACQLIDISSGNTAIGHGTLSTYNDPSGYNTAVGLNSLASLSTGTNNIAIGSNAGALYSGSESNNLTIFNVGQFGDQNTIRIGDPLQHVAKTYIEGIYNVPVAGLQVVGITSGSHLCTVPDGLSGQVLTSAGPGGMLSWQTPTSGTVTSVSGTLNRITSTGGATPVIDISASYVGQTSITTLGTITTGTWNGTAIVATQGGTSQTTYTTGDILYASAANTLSKRAIGSTDQVLTVVGGVPAWAANTAFKTINIQKFTASGTYTPTANMKYCLIQAWGGGGGGGGAQNGGANTYGVGGGGAGGNYASQNFSAATIGASKTVTIGVGGTAGTGSTAGAGGAGGITSVAALIAVAGGAGGGGHVAAAGTGGAVGGAPGGSGGATIEFFGGSGGTSIGCGTGLFAYSGFGGNAPQQSYTAGRTAIGYGATAVVGVTAAANSGSGGSGGMSVSGGGDADGGAGASGLVIITEYI